MRRSELLLTLSVLAPLALSACDSSHMRGDDAGPRPDASSPDASASLDGGGICPDGIDPWNPMSPGSRCTTEGERCSSGGGSVCGAGMFCECRSGSWSCAVAEPDPACYCGREPEPGSPCNVEGDSCGACCPMPGENAWAPLTCSGGRWEPLGCPPIECPGDPAPCPADRPAAVGQPCDGSSRICGNPCCGEAITCSPDGVWVSGPDAACACAPDSSFACGPGSCTSDRACVSFCGPTDGVEHRCDALPEGCSSCACAVVSPGQVCEERDGRVFLSVAGFCG